MKSLKDAVERFIDGESFLVAAPGAIINVRLPFFENVLSRRVRFALAVALIVPAHDREGVWVLLVPRSGRGLTLLKGLDISGVTKELVRSIRARIQAETLGWPQLRFVVHGRAIGIAETNATQKHPRFSR